MADFDTSEFRAARFERSRADEIGERSFPIVMRGYDRAAVDAFVQEVRELVAELESRQSQESVVQRALAEVGEETTSILQRAHETADEIAARSRAQAEGRIQRAEREADLVRKQADAYSEQIIVDTRLLWEERQRLIEDIRQLADDVLNTAEEAFERVTLPEMLSEQKDDETVVHGEDNTTRANEVEFDVLPGGAEAGDTDAEEATQEEDETR
jgi:DivIVA domain-containing protein